MAAELDAKSRAEQWAAYTVRRDGIPIPFRQSPVYIVDLSPEQIAAGVPSATLLPELPEGFVYRPDASVVDSFDQTVVAVRHTYRVLADADVLAARLRRVRAQRILRRLTRAASRPAH